MPTSPEVPAVVRKMYDFKAELLSKDNATMTALVEGWAPVHQELGVKIEGLLQTIENLTAAGVDVPKGTLFELRYAKQVKAQMAEALSHFGEYADAQITKAQADAGLMGLEHAANVLGTQTAVTSFTFVDPQVVETMVGMTQDGTPVGDLIRKRVVQDGSLDAVKSVKRWLRAGPGMGLNPHEVAVKIKGDLQGGLDKALVIARTEQMRAYRETTRMQYDASGVVIGYKRMASHSLRTCLACLLADGRRYNVKSSFQDHPNGRCTLVPIIDGEEEPTWESGLEWFQKLNEAQQRKVLGPKRYKAWKDGDVADLMDFVRYAPNETWGGMVVPATLKQAIESPTPLPQETMKVLPAPAVKGPAAPIPTKVPGQMPPLEEFLETISFSKVAGKPNLTKLEHPSGWSGTLTYQGGKFKLELYPPGETTPAVTQKIIGKMADAKGAAGAKLYRLAFKEGTLISAEPLPPPPPAFEEWAPGVKWTKSSQNKNKTYGELPDGGRIILTNQGGKYKVEVQAKLADGTYGELVESKTIGKVAQAKDDALLHLYEATHGSQAVHVGTGAPGTPIPTLVPPEPPEPTPWPDDYFVEFEDGYVQIGGTGGAALQKETVYQALSQGKTAEEVLYYAQKGKWPKAGENLPTITKAKPDAYPPHWELSGPGVYTIEGQVYTAEQVAAVTSGHTNPDAYFKLKSWYGTKADAAGGIVSFDDGTEVPWTWAVKKVGLGKEELAKLAKTPKPADFADSFVWQKDPTNKNLTLGTVKLEGGTYNLSLKYQGKKFAVEIVDPQGTVIVETTITGKIADAKGQIYELLWAESGYNESPHGKQTIAGMTKVAADQQTGTKVKKKAAKIPEHAKQTVTAAPAGESMTHSPITSELETLKLTTPNADGSYYIVIGNTVAKVTDGKYVSISGELADLTLGYEGGELQWQFGNISPEAATQKVAAFHVEKKLGKAQTSYVDSETLELKNAVKATTSTPGSHWGALKPSVTQSTPAAPPAVSPYSKVEQMVASYKVKKGMITEESYAVEGAHIFADLEEQPGGIWHASIAKKDDPGDFELEIFDSWEEAMTKLVSLDYTEEQIATLPAEDLAASDEALMLPYEEAKEVGGYIKKSGVQMPPPPKPKPVAKPAPAPKVKPTFDPGLAADPKDVAAYVKGSHKGGAASWELKAPPGWEIKVGSQPHWGSKYQHNVLVKGPGGVEVSKTVYGTSTDAKAAAVSLIWESGGHDKLPHYSAKSAVKNAPKKPTAPLPGAATPGSSPAATPTDIKPSVKITKPAGGAKSASGIDTSTTLEDGYTKTSGKKGTNEGGWFKAKSGPGKGEEWYFKRYPEDDKAVAEHVTRVLYERMGYVTPESKLIRDKSGKIHVGAKKLEGATVIDLSAPSAEARTTLLSSTLLGDRDWNKSGNHLEVGGKVAAIDAGGSLHFRAVNGTKPYTVDSVQTDLDGMLSYDHTGLWGDLSAAEWRANRQRIELLTDADIDAAFSGSGLEHMAPIVKGRRDKLIGIAKAKEAAAAKAAKDAAAIKAKADKRLASLPPFKPRKFSSDVEAHNWGYSTFGKRSEFFSSNGLGYDHVSAMDSYKGSGYGSINGGLRTAAAGGTKSRSKKVKLLDEAFRVAQKLPEDVILKRSWGARIGARQINAAALSSNPSQLQNLIGFQFAEPGYSSASVHPHWNWGSHSKVMCEIRARKGTRGIWIEQGGTGHTYEGEFLLPRDTLFEVVDARVSNGRVTLTLEIIDQPVR